MREEARPQKAGTSPGKASPISWNFHFDLPGCRLIYTRYYAEVNQIISSHDLPVGWPQLSSHNQLQQSLPRDFSDTASCWVTSFPVVSRPGRASACGHGQRTDSPEHHSKQASRQVTLGQQQPVIPRMLHQPPTRLHQPLLQTGQRPGVNSLRQQQPPPQVTEVVRQHAQL